MANAVRKIVSVQIAPIKSTGGATDDIGVEIQTNGADKDTVAHAVYVRYDDGKVEHVSDQPFEADAIKIAQVLSKENNAPIELPAWLVPYTMPAITGM